MNFLAPLFMLGGAAIVGPILFHLIRRTTREVTPFSSLMFLMPTPPRVTRRSRLENLWLLALRCLVLLLLAIGFARPFVKRHDAAEAQAPSGKRRVTMLLDTSASMRRDDLWTQARAKALELCRKAAPGDEFELVAFDRTSRPILSAEEWRRLAPNERASVAAQRLDATKPTWAATELGTAMIRAAENLQADANASDASHELVVISDLQESARIDALQGFEWPRGFAVSFEPLKPAHTANASAQWIAESTETQPEADAANAEPRIRVTNAAASKREQFTLRWNDTTKLDVYVPAGQSRVVRAPKQAAPRSEKVTLTGDDVEFDNTLFVAPPEPQRLPVLFVGDESPTEPKQSLYYLDRAFQKTAHERIELLARPGSAAPAAFELQQAQLFVLGDGASERAVEAARAFANDGHTVVLPFTSAASAGVLSKLLGGASLLAEEAPVKDYAMLSQIDFQHPLFAAFADPRFSDFTKILFWHYRRAPLEKLPGARVLAKFDTGDTAIAQVPIGRGSVVVLASSWRPADSQLALSSKFVPLLFALLDQSSALPPQRAQYFIGDEVPLPPAQQPWKIRTPDGRELEAAAGGKFTATDVPGIYSITPGTQRFVVNLAPGESITSTQTVDHFASLGVPLQRTAEQVAAAQQTAAQQRAAELESRQKLWRWLVGAALGVLLIETLLAGTLTRGSAAIREPSA